MVISYEGIKRFISRWMVVPDDELLSITVLGGDYVVTKSSVNIFPHSDIIVEYFFSKVVCVCVFLCNICLINFNSSQHYSHRRLSPSSRSSQLYADSDLSLAIRRHQSITLSESLTSSHPIVPFSLPSI